MSNFRTIKGTHDILPNDLLLWKYIKDNIEYIMDQHGYCEIKTPVFENTELFIRGIGTNTDIVNKEMYSWIDQGNNNLTLRPELTAPVARSYLQNKLGNVNPLQRLWYFDSLFRRERPQKGRQRQFYQFGVESIGSEHPEQDAEIITLAYNIFKKFDIADINVQINSIGNTDIRTKYLLTLKNSLTKIKINLCKSCQSRIERNALRLFDCKNTICQEILDDNAPFIFDYISKSDLIHFEMVTQILDNIGIPFTHNKKLVRGLDYYSHTTFEIKSKSLGSQDALCGGGRYNGLIEQLGGKPTPAVGFAAGVERLVLAINKNNIIENIPDFYLILLGEKATIIGSKIANDIRFKLEKKVIMETLRRSLKAQMREASRSKAKTVIILGEDELAQNKIIVKNMSTSNQDVIPISKLNQYLSTIS